MAGSNYNDRYDDITYEKGWKRASTPEVYVPPEESEEENTYRRGRRNGEGQSQNHNKQRGNYKKYKKPPRKFLLLTIRLAVCAVVLAAALVFKQFGGEEYEELKAVYFEQLNNSLFETPPEDILDLSEIFNHTSENASDATENS